MMKRLITFILATCLSCAVFAQGNQPASAASIEKLLEVTEAKKMYDVSMKEATKTIDTSMTGIISRLPPEKQARFRQVVSEVDKFMEEEVSWEKMKPLYIQIYTKTFTQREVDDLMAFYQTPSGRSFVKKQPEVLREMAVLTQEKMGCLMERLPDIVQKAMAEGN